MFLLLSAYLKNIYMKFPGGYNSALELARTQNVLMTLAVFVAAYCILHRSQTFE